MLSNPTNFNQNTQRKLPGFSPWHIKQDTEQNQQENNYRYDDYPRKYKTTRNTNYINENLTNCSTKKTLLRQNQSYSKKRMILGPIYENPCSIRRQTMLVIRQNQTISVQKPPIEKVLCVRMFQVCETQGMRQSPKVLPLLKNKKIQFKIDSNKKHHRSVAPRKIKLI